MFPRAPHRRTGSRAAPLQAVVSGEESKFYVRGGCKAPSPHGASLSRSISPFVSEPLRSRARLPQSPVSTRRFTSRCTSPLVPEPRHSLAASAKPRLHTEPHSRAAPAKPRLHTESHSRTALPLLCPSRFAPAHGIRKAPSPHGATRRLAPALHFPSCVRAASLSRTASASSVSTRHLTPALRFPSRVRPSRVRSASPLMSGSFAPLRAPFCASAVAYAPPRHPLLTSPHVNPSRSPYTSASRCRLRPTRRRC